MTSAPSLSDSRQHLRIFPVSSFISGPTHLTLHWGGPVNNDHYSGHAKPLCDEMKMQCHNVIEKLAKTETRQKKLPDLFIY